MIRKLIDWLTLADFDAARNAASAQVVARYCRGNVAIQNGWVLDEQGLRALSLQADQAMARLRRHIPL